MDNQPQQPPPLPQGGYQQHPPPNPPHRAPGLGFTFLQSCLVAGCATVMAPFVMLLGLVLVVVITLSFTGVDETALDTYAGGDIRVKVVREGRDDAGIITIINVQGAIDGAGSPLDGGGAMAQVAEQLRLVREDKRVKAVLLQIDSPGGGLTASDLLHHEVERTRAEGKIVVAWAGGVMASGGYYVAVAADGVMASPTATIGSIGVMMQHFQAGDLLKKLGVEADPILSGSHKDLGSMYREMTPEERQLLQDYVDASHRRFVDIVAAGRDKPAEEIAPLADGRIFTAHQAREYGLIDRIGYVEEAVEWIEELTGERNMRVVAFRRMFSLNELLSTVASDAAGALVGQAAESAAMPRMMAR